MQRSVAGNPSTDGLGPAVLSGPRTASIGKQRPGHDFSQIPVHGRTPTTLQTKLSVNAPGDVYEQEAEAVADSVVRSATEATSQIQRNNRADLIIQRMTSKKSTAQIAPPIVEEVLRSPGQPLDADTRAFMEPHFGHDFSQVRVHSGGSAEQSARDVSANAYTVGRHIVFDSGRFAPRTHEGRLLLAHELTHVVQQSGAKRNPSAQDHESRSISPVFASLAPRGVQRQPVSDPPPSPTPLANTAPSHPDTPTKLPAAKPMTDLVTGWRGAGLLDPPFRSSGIAAIPEFPVVKEAIEQPPPTKLGADANAGVALGPTLSPTSPVPAFRPPPIRPSTPTAPVSPLTPVPPAALGPAAAPAASPLAGAAPLVAAAAAGVYFFWSTHGPAWADSINPYTGFVYRSKEEYVGVMLWNKQLTEQQRDYLRFLAKARQLQPNPALEAERSWSVSPGMFPSMEPGVVKGCFKAPIPRLGGNQRHDAYATQVTGTAFDFLVLPPLFLLGIAFDGLGPGQKVWEVKVGFEWMFNDEKKDLRISTLADWTIQKDRGLAAASSCGYVHLWAIPSVHVAALLTAFWGGIPLVLAIPEVGGTAPPRYPQ
ncbi:DUF4157 domain-containing protein [Edaphobacter sp. HDX4]|uniref:eCIS core domain-containing protein n=1 Tax=Edaphobacter sp. HDX4 TaxID=2794064 RepID=UPI002FE64A84